MTTATAVRTLSGPLRWATRRWRTRRMWRVGLAWRHKMERYLFRHGYHPDNLRGWIHMAILHKRYMDMPPEQLAEAKALWARLRKNE